MSFPATESLAEQIARHLASRIIEGELRPGERIQEARVVNELDVRRGSVRHSPGETEYASRFFAGLMDAVLKRAPQNIPAVVETYGQHQRALVLAALAQEQTHAS